MPQSRARDQDLQTNLKGEAELEPHLSRPVTPSLALAPRAQPTRNDAGQAVRPGISQDAEPGRARARQRGPTAGRVPRTVQERVRVAMLLALCVDASVAFVALPAATQHALRLGGSHKRRLRGGGLPSALLWAIEAAMALRRKAR